MKVKSIAANQTEITLPNGTQVLYSYSTPVAAYDADRGKWLRTNQKWSPTTTRHINKWLETIDAESVDQSEIDNLS